MALTQEFNEFAGKIISGSEVKKRLQETGFPYDLDDMSSFPPELRRTLVNKILTLSEEEQEEYGKILEDIKNGVYIEADTFKALTDPVLQAPNEASAVAHMMLAQDRLKSCRDKAYIAAQPYVRFMMWALAGDKMADDFMKAVSQCADHSKDPDLVNYAKGVKAVIKSVESKFDR